MSDTSLDAILDALAHPVRRAILDRVRASPGDSAGRLCAKLGLTRFAFRRHVRFLERARLVVRRRVGRERRFHVDAAPVRLLQAWLAKHVEERSVPRRQEARARGRVRERAPEGRRARPPRPRRAGSP